MSNAAGYTLVYYINAEAFPTLFFGTSMMVTQVVSRLVAILGPFIAEIRQPVPVVFLITSGALGLVAVLFLRKK